MPSMYGYPFARPAGDPSVREQIEPQHLLAWLHQRLEELLQTNLTPQELHLPLIFLGIDSLLALQLREQLVENFGIDLPTSLFLNGRSCAQLVECLCGGNYPSPSSPRPS